MVFESLMQPYPSGGVRFEPQHTLSGSTGIERPIRRSGQCMYQNFVKARRHDSPAVFGMVEAIGPICCPGINDIASRQERLDLLALKPFINRLPGLAPVSRAKHAAAESAGIDCSIIAGDERKDERVGDPLP